MASSCSWTEIKTGKIMMSLQILSQLLNSFFSHVMLHTFRFSPAPILTKRKLCPLEILRNAFFWNALPQVFVLLTSSHHSEFNAAISIQRDPSYPADLVSSSPSPCAL